MKAKIVVASGLLAAAALAASLLPAPWSDPARAQDAKASVRWEYCELAGDHTGKCVLASAKETTRAESWEDLAKKLKAPLKGDNLSDQSVRLAIFDYLGSQGWELATHTTFTMNGAFVSAKTFKRRM
jgi:hypothetical protein